MNRMLAGFIALVVLGAIVAVTLVSVTSSDSQDTSTEGAETRFRDSVVNGPGNGNVAGPDEDSSVGTGKDGLESDGDESASGQVINALAIGDWGTTLEKPGSNVHRYKKEDSRGALYYQHYWAQKNVATLLANAGKEMKPDVVIGHGDNFYWTGVSAFDAKSRFDTTFEDMYDQESLKDVPWVNVMGNHDYGGSSYICHDKNGRLVPCEDTASMLKGLKLKFELQQKYVSPNGNRWKMTGHYFKHSIQNGDITMDIFNVDTNYADVHGAKQICCQCYGYSLGSGGVDCERTNRGDKYCAGGDTEMYDTCFDQLKVWGEESLTSLARDAKASTADWKIVNSHYSPYIDMPQRKDEWFNVLQEAGIQVFINGHTHGEKHDFATINTHFIENGAGGGIQSSSPSRPPAHFPDITSVWHPQGAPYGIFQFLATKKNLRVRFHTFDDTWEFTKNLQDTVRGGNKIPHCWDVPRDGSRGKSCN